MSDAGNADSHSEKKGRLKVRLLTTVSLIVWALAYFVTYYLSLQMLQIAEFMNPYIGYKVPLSIVSLFISTFIMLAGVILAYIFYPSKHVFRLVLMNSAIFVVINYIYLYSIFLGRSKKLNIELMPFSVKFISSTGHESIAIDYGQIIIAALLIYLITKVVLRRKG